MIKRVFIGGSIIVLTVLAASGVWFFGLRDKPAAKVESAVDQYTQLQIGLKDGKLTSEAATYLVNPGVGLEFTVTSNKFGKVSVPTEPPQTITFTQSPLVFKFKSSHNPGSYALLYQAADSAEAIQIGTIVVRDTQK
ncbi:MAG TPA: hypothetical protein VK674_03585 [Candidatus Limnocylindria bacterium]|nr:hypothetical protein [Candidatus Limnocylindria bacterium]